MKLKKYLAGMLTIALSSNYIGMTSYALNTTPSLLYNSIDFTDKLDTKTDDTINFERPFNWEQGGTLLSDRVNASSVNIGTKAYIIGGFDYNNPLKTLEIYDLETNTSSYGSSMNVGRSGLSTVSLDNKIYCMGGHTGYYTNSATNTMEIYDVLTDSWSTATPMPNARTEFTVQAIGKKIYCIGGYNSTGYLDKVDVYDTESNTWETKKNMPTKRQALSSSVYNDKIYCFGGYNGQTLSKLEIYDPKTDTWSSSNSYFNNFEYGMACTIENTIYVLFKKGTSTYLYAYSPKKDAWYSNSFDGATRYIVKSSSILYNDCLYIFGGDNAEKSINKIPLSIKSDIVTNYSISFAGGDGTKDNPFQISTSSELARLSHLVNDLDFNTQNIHFELINDIDLKDYSCNDLYKGIWFPIGVRATKAFDRSNFDFKYSFRGVFNGNGHTISNLNIENFKKGNTLGLFGTIESTEINNLNLSNINIKTSPSTLYATYNFVGGVAGYGIGQIKITDVNIDGNIIADSVGGIIGRLEGEDTSYLTNCNTNIIIESKYYFRNTGGIIGFAYNVVIDNCHTNGNIISTNSLNNNGSSTVGGLAGAIYGDRWYFDEDVDSVFCIKDSTSNTKIVLDKDTNYLIGGFIGYYGGDDVTVSYIKNCTANTEMYFNSTYSDVAGFIGEIADSVLLENCFATGLIKGELESVSAFLGIGKSFSINNCYSTLNIEGAESTAGVINNITKSFDSISNYYYAGKTSNDIIYSLNSDKSTFYPVVMDLNTSVLLDNINNIYYDTDIINANINIENIENIENIKGLSTSEMIGKEAKESMNLDYNNTWKLNKEYYPTFEQINTAPDIIPNDKVIDSIITINQYDNFNPLDYVTIEDFEGDKVTTQVEESIDTSKYGPFFVTYTAIDDKGLSSILTLTVKINPLLITMNNAPIINANDIILTVGDKFMPLDVIEVTDIEDENLLSETKVVKNTVNTNKAGIYSVTYEVTDKDGAKTTKTITVTVKDKLVANNNQNNSDTNDKNNDKDKDIINNNIAKPQTYDLGILVYLIFFTCSICVLILNNKKHKINK